jgi:hypothetical protein
MAALIGSGYSRVAVPDPVTLHRSRPWTCPEKFAVTVLPLSCPLNVAVPLPIGNPATETVNETVVAERSPSGVNVTANGTSVLELPDVKLNTPLIVLPLWFVTLALNVPCDVPLFDGSRQLLNVTLPDPTYVPTRRVATATLVDPRTVV